VNGLKVVLAATGSRGDVQPTVALAMGLCAAGHEVTVCAPPDFESWVRRFGLPFAAVGRDVAAWMAQEAGRIANPLAFARLAGRELRHEVAAQFEDLEKPVGDADLVVGVALLFAARTLAEARGVPYRHVIVGPQPLPSRHHPPPFLPWQFRNPLLNRTLWRLQRSFVNRFVGRLIDERRARLGLGPVGDVLDHLGGAGVLVESDAAIAPVPPDVRLPNLQTGHWPLPAVPLPEDLRPFLDAGPPPVYVGFGSMGEPNAQATSEAVRRALEGVGARGVLAGPWEIPGCYTLRGEVAHAPLFARCAVVVHHGGSGTTATAARAGVPQVVVPHWLDQYNWAYRVHLLGVGPRPVFRHRLSAQRLGGALAACLSDEAIRTRARQLAGALAGDDGVARAVAYLEEAART
jgi:vancomycin aglycone glucosyltransferase